MQAVIDRDYCLRHPAKIIRLFGFKVYVGMLVDKRKTLLERLVEHYRLHATAAPGSVGNAYKCSALVEFRVARIYAAMAERFAEDPEAATLFQDLSEEEMEHGRIMLTCLFYVTAGPDLRFVPSVRDPRVRDTMNRLRELEQRVPQMDLDEALRATAELEGGEVNVIFGRLLAQVDEAQLSLFAEQLEASQNHSESVPRRIAELKQRSKAGTAAM
jgi:rubrerythrin